VGGELRWLFRGSVRQPCNRRRREKGEREGGNEGRASGELARERAPGLLAGTAAGSEVAAGLEGNFCGRVRPGAPWSLPARAGRVCWQLQVVSAKSFAALLPGSRKSILGSDSFQGLRNPHLAQGTLRLKIRKGAGTAGILHLTMRPEGCVWVLDRGSSQTGSQITAAVKLGSWGKWARGHNSFKP
jgi:hypothetical protein